MNSSKCFSFALVTAIACFTGAIAVHAITITSNSIVSISSSSAGNANSSFTGTGIPNSQLLNPTTGAYYTRTQIDYTGTGNQVSLLNSFDDKRSGLVFNYSSTEGQMNFTADANTTYSLSGEFKASDASTAGYLYFESFLRDLTSSTTLAYSNQVSGGTLNESFVLGGSGGDNSNIFAGSLTGSLIAGHQYNWHYYALTEAYPDADGGATATGYARLDIGGGASSSVPDNVSTIAMMGVAFLGLGLIRRKIAA